MLQTEPQIQEVLGIDERGHDYFLQMTDARPDTGGLSGATPAEAVSWGKIDPDQLPGTVVVYADNSITLPLLTAYAAARRPPRPLKRLYRRREAMMRRLTEEYRAALEFRDRRAEDSLAHLHPGAGDSRRPGGDLAAAPTRYRWYSASPRNLPQRSTGTSSTRCSADQATSLTVPTRLARLRLYPGVLGGALPGGWRPALRRP
jgi:hypothetical protein